MGRRGLVIGLTLAAISVLSVFPSFAQIRIVPRESLDSLAHPALAADSLAFDFAPAWIDAGTLTASAEPVRFEFRFRNASDRPVLIVKTATDCACLKASHGKDAVPPGEYGTVTADFYAEGHFGKFERRIFVYSASSAGRPSAVLRIRVTVTDEKESEK
ncbi:MAG: DUF1573 domain-containing protein [Candidatus Cryptobacteroides sp.]